MDGAKDCVLTWGGLVSRSHSTIMVANIMGRTEVQLAQQLKDGKYKPVEEEKAWICANMRNGNWYCGGYFVLQTAFNNKKLRELGYPTFTEFYLKVCEN